MYIKPVNLFIKPRKIDHTFLWCSLLLIAVLSFPRLGGHEALWMNGIYDAAAIILQFSFIVYLGASGNTGGGTAARISKFLGDISYPIYIIHYPLIYMFMAWVAKNNDYIKAGSTGAIISVVIAAIIVLGSAIGIAYACVKLYDVPVRKWLTKKFMRRPS